MYMLNYLFQKMKQEEAKENWQEHGPKVRVKEEYLTFVPPPCKADDPSIKRTDWPKELQKDFVPLPEFFNYLDQHQRKGEAQVGYFVLGAGRALGALEVCDSAGEELATPKSDVSILLALYTSGEYARLVETPLFHPKYSTWTKGMLEGVANYANFQIRDLRRQLLVIISNLLIITSRLLVIHY